MTAWCIVLAASMVATGSPNPAAERCAAPPEQEGPAASAPRTESPPVQPPRATLGAACAALLDKVDAAGRDLKTVHARFDYELNQTLFEDIKRREGVLAFEAPNRLRFEFTGREKEAFIFDGRTLYHRQDAVEQMHEWEVRRADEPPVESFELGKTPFPMPFGQKKEAVLKHFDVKLGPAVKGTDGKERPALVLAPKKGTQLVETYTRITLWFDPETYLPVQARLWDTSENITTIAFHDIRTNAKVPPRTFERPKVPGGWEVIRHRREPAEAGVPTETP